MAYALSLASDLGFMIPSPQGNAKTNENSDDLVKVLRDLTTMQRNLADLQVELQGCKDRIIARLQQPYSLDCIPAEAVFQEMLRPIPVALASCTRFFEALSAMRDSFAKL